MNYLKITNKGEIDVNALFLMGASTKEGDSSKIGFFGSGNKYAMACLLRKGIKFFIFSGERLVAIELKPVIFGGQEFQQIWIDGIPTSFTTRMGPDWETWFSIREFICNAKDEGMIDMNVVLDTFGLEGEPDITTIYVECIPEVADFYEELNNYVLQEDPGIEEDTVYGKVSIIPNDGEYLALYRKTIRCNSLKENRKSLFHYNFDDIDINESRVFKYEWQVNERIQEALAVCADKETIQKYLKESCNDTFYEGKMYWGNVNGFSTVWFDLLEGITIFKKNQVQFLAADKTVGGIILPDELVKLLGDQFPSLKIYGEYNAKFFEVEEDIDDEILMVHKAMKEVDALDIPGSGLAFKIVHFKDNSTMAMFVNGVSHLSLEHLRKGFDTTLEIVMEEACHHAGHPSGTVSMERYLIKKLIKISREQ